MTSRHTEKLLINCIEQFYIPFYSNTMEHNQLLHLMRYLHFNNNTEQQYK